MTKMSNDMDKIFFNEIMREYDLIRIKNKKEADMKKKNLYERYPELDELEKKISEIGLSVAKLVLKKFDMKEIEKLKKESQILVEKYNFIFKKIGLSKNYFEVYDCKICHDTGFINNKKCDCLKKKLVEKYCNMSSLGKILEQENFANFNFKYYEGESLKLIKKAYKASLLFVKYFGVRFKNLFFYGDTGLGKTFLCNCIAKEILNMGKSVLYKTAPELFKMLDEIRFSNYEKNIEREKIIFDCDLLIIDDLGSEYQTRPLESDLFNTINLRLLNKKPVIISTNMNANELPEFYKQRIVSRIYGYYDMFEFVGEDIRIKKRM